MKIVDEREAKKDRTVVACDIPLNTIFSGRIENRDNVDIYLKAYETVISLENAEHTWDQDVTIHDYKVLQARIVIEGKK